MSSSLSKQVSSVVPLLDLRAQYLVIGQEIEEAVLEVLRSGHYILGPNVNAFENEAAQFLNTKHVISCANGSDALYLALLALDIKPGDEVITTPYTFAATAEAIAQVYAKPVFVDIDINSFNIDPKQIETKITDKTKAIIVVHLYGQACDMDAIMAIARKHNLKVIEDTAQSFGTTYISRNEQLAAISRLANSEQPELIESSMRTAKNERNAEIAQGCRFYAGCIGDIGTYSFYPTKNLSAAGDAGMLSTNDDEIAARLKRIRAHGSSRRYYHDELGVNSRMDEIQAAILRIKLRYISAWNSSRVEIANFYNTKLSSKEFQGSEIITPSVIDKSTHIYHQYTIRLKNEELNYDELEAQRSILKEK